MKELIENTERVLAEIGPVLSVFITVAVMAVFPILVFRVVLGDLLGKI
jgi:hypothetical protein